MHLKTTVLYFIRFWNFSLGESESLVHHTTRNRVSPVVFDSLLVPYLYFSLIHSFCLFSLSFSLPLYTHTDTHIHTHIHAHTPLTRVYQNAQADCLPHPLFLWLLPSYKLQRHSLPEEVTPLLPLCPASCPPSVKVWDNQSYGSSHVETKVMDVGSHFGTVLISNPGAFTGWLAYLFIHSFNKHLLPMCLAQY